MSVGFLLKLATGPMMLEQTHARTAMVAAGHLSAHGEHAHTKRRAWLASRPCAEMVSAAGSVAKSAGTIGIGVIEVAGVLGQTEADVTDSEGVKFGTSYEAIAAQCEAFGSSNAVSEVVLLIDSPGGAAVGCDACYRAVAKLAQIKPVSVYSVGMCCSAALYLACGATPGRLWISPSCMIGSIGTTCYHVDESKQLADLGLKVTQFASAPGKLLAATHRPLESADSAALQEMCDKLGAEFAGAVAKARGVSAEKVKEWGAASCLIGQEAVDAGLADAIVTTFSEALSKIAQASSNSKLKATNAAARAVPTHKPAAKVRCFMTLTELMQAEGGPALAESLRAEGRASVPANQPATITDIRAIAGGDSDFVLDCIEKKMTLGQAQAEALKKSTAELAAIKAENETLVKAAKDKTEVLAKLGAAGVKVGAKPVAHGEVAQGNSGDFEAMVQAEIATAKANGQTMLRSVAVFQASKKYPELASQARDSIRPGAAGMAGAGLRVG